LGGVGQLLAGGLSGGVASELFGGNFWDGARNGLIVSGLNHLSHGDPIKLKTLAEVEELRKQSVANDAKGIQPDYTIESMVIPLWRGADLAKNWLLGKFAAKEGTNLVYQGIDKSGIVRYVGITEREATVRFSEHLNSGTAKSLLRYEVIDRANGLSRTGAKVWEQKLINQYGLGKNSGQLLNKINSIAPKYWSQYGIK
jgi:hypothetical protein